MTVRTKNLLTAAAAATTLGLLGASSASAATLALYDFEDNNLSVDGTTLAANVTASNLSFGAYNYPSNGGPLFLDSSGVTDGGGNGVAIASPLSGTVLTGDLHNIRVGSDTLAEALTYGNYLSFTLTPSAGFAIDLSALTFDFQSVAGNNSSAYVLVDANNNGFDAGDLIDGGPDNLAVTTASYSLDLTGLADITSATEIRFYLANAASTSHDIALDNIAFEGVVTPEPGSLALLGLGGLLIGARRRRG